MGATLVTTFVVGLYPNIAYDLGLQSLSKGLNETGMCKESTYYRVHSIGI